MRSFVSGCILLFTGLSFWNCTQKPIVHVETAFTKADSVTDLYLAFQDSLLKSWNVMINHDNHKIKGMHNLLHELLISNPDEREKFTSLEERLDQLIRMRYTQKSMMNTDVISEYDLATLSLISELINEAEQKKEFSYNPTLQRLVLDIQLAYDRTFTHRISYDSVANAYNHFLEENKNHLLEIDHEWALEKKPLFQIVSAD